MFNPFRRRIRYDKYRDPAPLTLRGGRAARVTKRCMPKAGSFGPGLPGSICVEVLREQLPSGIPRQVQSPTDMLKMAQILSAAYAVTDREWFIVLVFDNQLGLWGWYTAAVGGASTVQIEIPTALQPLVASGKIRFSVVHNHPSGNATPSREDIAMTLRLGEASTLLGLQMLDHIVIGANGAYSSLAELGYIGA